MEVPVSLESEIELFTTKEFDEAILLHNTSALVPVLKKALQTNEYQSVGLGKPIVPLKKDLLYLSAIAGADRAWPEMKTAAIYTCKEDRQSQFRSKLRR